jgi:TrmH family RNA methyltransferase
MILCHSRLVREDGESKSLNRGRRGVRYVYYTEEGSSRSLDRVNDAIRPRRYQKGADCSYALGVFPTFELLKHRPAEATGVWLRSLGERNEGVAQIRQRCQRLGIPCEVDDRLMERLAPMENCYALGAFRLYHAPLHTTAPHLLLVHPDDLGNLGTIARTMVGFGWFDLAIVRPAPDLFHPKAIRASMGAIFQLRIQYFPNFQNYNQAFPRPLFPFCTNGDVDLCDAHFPSSCTLAFGHEGAGLPQEVTRLGSGVRIRFLPTVDSLSLPVSVGIALYHATQAKECTHRSRAEEAWPERPGSAQVSLLSKKSIVAGDPSG